jgi:VanZ family protein
VVWSLTALYAIALFIATHLPPSEIPKLRTGDKFLHFTAYLVLGTLFCMSLWPTRLSSVIVGITALMAALAFGAIEEWTQPIVGRICSIRDWYADAAGATCAVIVMTLVRIFGWRHDASGDDPQPVTRRG